MTPIPHAYQSFREAEGGAVAILFAVLAVPVALLAGGATDYSRAYNERARLQSAADAAALAAARPLVATNAERTTIGEKVFSANMTKAANQQVTPLVTFPDGKVQVDASSSVGTLFLGLAGLGGITTSVSAQAKPGNTVATTTDVTASTTENRGKICILALDPNNENGIHLQGDNQVNYADCWAHTNSVKTTAINANGNNAKATGKGHCAVGGYTQTHDTFSPVPETGCLTVADPFATVSAYAAGQVYTPTFTPPTKAITCKASNLNLKKGTFTLDPGRYCGGITLQAGATVTLNSGIYYIDNGNFKVQSGSSVSGSNVLLYLAGENAKMEIIGGGTVNLSGRTKTASYAGFLAIADANAGSSVGATSNIQGGGTFKLQGMVYLPTQTLEVSGNGDVNASGIEVFGMVAKNFDFRGNGVFNSKKHTGNGNVPDIMPVMPLAVTTVVGGLRETQLNN